jgi:hypothetical protein
MMDNIKILVKGETERMINGERQLHEWTDVDTKQTDRQTKPSVFMMYDAVMELSQQSRKKKNDNETSRGNS